MQYFFRVYEDNAEKLGTDTYEVSWHSGARPSHQEWQGKQYTMDELKSVCGLGTVTGLNGANCYHVYYPLIPGISVPTYTAEELEELNKKENSPVKYGDKEYTRYEALQRQRRLETTMRAQRQKIKLLETGNADEDDIIAARCRYRGTSQEYARFSKAMDLPQQRQRVTVDGLGNIGVGKWKKSVDKSGESGIIKSKEVSKIENLSDISLNEEVQQLKHSNNFRQGSKKFSESAKRKLYENERILSSNNFETAILYDEDGNVIFKKKGNADSVSFSEKEKKQMKGCVLTHNHPNGSVFSSNDINMLRTGILSEIRACNSKGTYVLRRSDDWNSEISTFEELDKRYWEAMNLAGCEFAEKAAKEGKHPLYYIREMDEKGIEIFSKKYGLEFEWEEKDG